MSFWWIIGISVVFFLAMLALVLFVRARTVSRNRRTKSGFYFFWDGKKVCEVDPIEVMMRLEEHPEFRLDLDIRRIAEDQDREAMRKMASAVSHAFGVKEFTKPRKPGLTVLERFELLVSFLDYVEFQKKSIKSPQTSQQSTEATSTESDPTTTEDTLGTGSTDPVVSPSTA